MAKLRLDVYLAENALAESRSAAQALIMAGNVYIDNQKAMKAGEMLKGTIEKRHEEYLGVMDMFIS